MRRFNIVHNFSILAINLLTISNLILQGGMMLLAIIIDHVAKEAEVSTATVSRVLNNPEVVSDKTKEKVLKAIKKLNYSPNALARGLVTKKTHMIGVIVPDINNLFFPAIVRGIQDATAERDYQAIFTNTDNDVEQEISSIKSFKENRVDAIIVLGSRSKDPKKSQHLVELANDYHVVLVEDVIDDSNIYSVMHDETEGAYNAVKSLLEKGHRNIYHITVEPEFTTAEYKFRGYKKALNEYGISVDLKKIYHGTSYADSGIFVMNEILDSKKLPTAVFCGNDQIAIGAMTAIFSRGLRVPEDISIIGYSDIPIGKFVYPPLTTIGQDPQKTGRIAANIAIGLVTEDEGVQQRTILHTDLIDRKSVASLL